MLHILENLERCFNKYIRIIYNWHTLCLNANTAVKVVLKNSLLAFFSYRRTFLSFTLLSCLADPYLSYNASVICPTCPNAHRSELMKSELEGLLAASCGDKHLKTTPPSVSRTRPLPCSWSPLPTLCVFQFWLSKETEEERLRSVFLGHLSSYLLRSHSFPHLHNCRLYIRQKQDGSTTLHRKKELCRGPRGHAVTDQNAMYMTDIKNSVEQNNLSYGYSLLKEIPISYYKHIYSLGL